MKKILTIIISFIMIVSSNSIFIDAKETESFTVDHYTYEIIYTDDENIVYVTDNDTNETNTIIYDNSDHSLTIDGEIQEVSFAIELTEASVASYTKYGPYKVTFQAVFQTIGLLVGTILAISALASAIALCGVSSAAFTTALNDIYSSIGKVYDIVSGVTFKGYFQYYLQYNSSTKLYRYYNRRVYGKFGSSSYKYYSFGSGGWWSSSRTD